jgi:hypothetical protein
MSFSPAKADKKPKGNGIKDGPHPASPNGEGWPQHTTCVYAIVFWFF